MAKDKSFAAKIAKASKANATHCPVCGEVRVPLLVVESVKNEAKGTYKFNKNFVRVCQCNQNEVMS